MMPKCHAARYLAGGIATLRYGNESHEGARAIDGMELDVLGQKIQWSGGRGVGARRATAPVTAEGQFLTEVGWERLAVDSTGP